MAFSGLHVVCAFVGSDAYNRNASLLGRPVWSQTMAVAGTSAKVAPPVKSGSTNPVFHLRASADSFVAIGPNPDANNPAGDQKIVFVPAGEFVTVFVDPDDKLNWKAA